MTMDWLKWLGSSGIKHRSQMTRLQGSGPINEFKAD